MRGLAALATLMMILPGCLAGPDGSMTDTPGAESADGGALMFAEPVRVMAATYEPSVAIDAAGRFLVLDANGVDAARSLDGGVTWEEISLPDGPSASTYRASYPADNLLMAHGDTIWYSALIGTGVLVARTDDAGETWEAITEIAFTHPTATVADRQFMGFDGDEVTITWSQIPSGIFATSSADDGATWSTPTPVATIAERGGRLGQSGAPVAADGAWCVPMTWSQGETDVALRCSSDGLLWETSWVAPDGPGMFCGNWLPVAVMDNGHTAVAWACNDTLFVAFSREDGTWASTTLDGAIVGPWWVEGDGFLDLVWQGDDNGVQVTRFHDPWNSSLDRDTVQVGPEMDAVRTDLSFGARAPDGRLFVVWVDADGLYIAGEASASGSG